MIFLDTNVLIYACGLHDEDPRTEAARQLLSERTDYAISVQVIQEFYDRVVKPKRATPLTHERALFYVARWRRFTVLPITLELFDVAIALRTRFGYRYYDCAIIAAALALGCDTLYSEDMQHGQIIEGLTIINPFREGG